MAYTKEQGQDVSGSLSACDYISMPVKQQFEWSTRSHLMVIRKRISFEVWECRSPYRYARNREIVPSASWALTAEYGRSHFSREVAAWRRRLVKALQGEANLRKTQSGMISNSHKP